MSVETIAAPDRASVTAMDESLRGMMARLRAILAGPALTQDSLVEIISIYNNVAYVFLYLEANERHVRYDRLLPWRDRFYADPELDGRLAGLLEDLSCADPEAEDSRVRLLKQLRGKAQAPDPAAGERMAGLLAEAKGVLGQIQHDQLKLLGRLGVDGGTSPSAVFYRLASSMTDTARRSKLTRAWRVVRDGRQDALVDVVDRIIDEQRRQSASSGYGTTLAQTLEKCGVPESVIESFLERYLVRALDSYDCLAAQVRQVTGAATDPMDHFGVYLRTVFGAAPLPQFVLDECLDYIFAVARSTFGLEVRRVPSAAEHVLTTSVWAGADEVGTIHFDLWDTEHKTIKANTTKGIRNRTDWCGLVQHPVAYVSCRFRRDADGIHRITFQNVHSLFHEFGHAVNHLLIRQRIPNRSGLEYLPLERLENLSMWFEKWVYHPEFANRLASSPTDREGLEQCQRIKKMEYRGTYVDRAVTAALDFDIHRRLRGGVVDSFQRLDERFGISRHCRVGDFLAYFTWPMLQANPGAYFAYLWGASESGEMFARFEHLGLEEIAARPGLRDHFASCFDFDAPSREPDCTSVFGFYDGDGDGGDGGKGARDV
jgi:oligopeptidase A